MRVSTHISQALLPHPSDRANYFLGCHLCSWILGALHHPLYRVRKFCEHIYILSSNPHLSEYDDCDDDFSPTCFNYVYIGFFLLPEPPLPAFLSTTTPHFPSSSRCSNYVIHRLLLHSLRHSHPYHLFLLSTSFSFIILVATPMYPLSCSSIRGISVIAVASIASIYYPNLTHYSQHPHPIHLRLCLL